MNEREELMFDNICRLESQVNHLKKELQIYKDELDLVKDAAKSVLERVAYIPADIALDQFECLTKDSGYQRLKHLSNMTPDRHRH